MESATRPGSGYPVTYSVDYPDRDLNRLSTFFRVLWIIPIAIVLHTVSGWSGTGYEGNDWVARSTTPADGDAEIRFAEIGLRFGQVDVSGMARGTLIDRRAAQSLGLASMRLSSASGAGAMLTGAFYNSPTMQVAGSAAGVVAVSSSIGSGTCERAQWTIRKPESCEATLSCS